MARGTCRCCGNEYSINADETVRYHLTADPDCHESPDSRKCRGAGLLPVGERELPEEDVDSVRGAVCRVCRHPVVLTANNRARSHLSVLTDKTCPGGSDWPLMSDGRGNFTDTAPDERGGEPRDGHAHEDRMGDPETGLDDATRIKALPSDERGPAVGARPEPEPTPVKPCGCRIGPGFTEDCPQCRKPDLLARMPEHVQTLAATNPEPERCPHRDGRTYAGTDEDGEDVWACERCGEREDPAVTRMKRHSRAKDRLGNLDEGVLFVRHTLKAPLDRLVYRAGTPTMGPLTATVVTAGPYAGRTGSLTDMDEEITCTDLNGRPRPRRDRATGATSPSSPGPQPTPSPVAPTTPDPTRAPTSTPATSPTAKPQSVPETAGSMRTTSFGPSVTASTPTPTAPRTGAMADAFSTPKQAVNESDKYDSYGRYKILHPVTGKKVNWTRATTFCKSIQDTYALSMWSQRMVLKGAALRSDLTAAAGTLEVKADKDRMNGLVDEAKKAAGDKIAANKGTAVHSYTEDRDRILVGLPVREREIPGEFVPTVQAYEAILSDFGLMPVPGLIEFTTAVLQYEVAGTSDRVYRVTRDITIKLNGRPVTLYAGEHVVGDIKTGADLSYGWQEIAIQLALYGQGLNTSGVWDWGTRTWSRPEDANGNQIQVRTDVGVVPHLPVDRTTTKAPLATLYAVDLTAGWAAAVLCGQVRSWRKERTLATPLEVADVAEEAPARKGLGPEGLVKDAQQPVSRPVAASRPVTIMDKAKAVTSKPEASAVYREAVAAKLPVSQVNELIQIMQAKLRSFTEQGA